jgi:hypothetical protein
VVAQEIAVGQYDALGLARRAGRVDERSLVFGPDGVGQGFEKPGLPGVERLSSLHDLAKSESAGRRRLAERDEVPDLTERGLDGLDLLPVLVIGDDDGPGVRVQDDVLDLFGHEGAVDRHRDRAQAEVRHIAHDPLGPVLGKQDDFVSFC